jgi:hypothetical protein
MLEGSHFHSRIKYAQMSLGIPKSLVKGKGGAACGPVSSPSAF